MANTTFLDLPVAVTLDGTEVFPIVQPANSTGGVSKRATVGQVAALSSNQSGGTGPFIMAGGTATPFFANSRYLAAQGDVDLTDGGPQGAFTVGPIATAAVTYAKFQEVPGLSALGVAGNATAVIAPIQASAAFQVLQVNAGGTGLVFAPIGTSSFSGTLTVPFGGTGDTSFTANGVLYGNGTSALLVTGAAANSILATNGSSVPALTQTIPDAVQANITHLGTVTTGTWNASVVTVSFGGTGTSTLAAHGLIVGNGVSGVNVTVPGTAGQIPIGQTATSDPVFTTVTGDMSLAAGGAATIATAAVTFAKFQQVAGLSVVGVSGTATNVVGAITGAASQVLQVNAGATGLLFAPLSVTASITGVITVPFGGTGDASLTAHGVLIGNGTGNVTVSAAPTAAQLLIGQTATSDPAWTSVVGDIGFTAAGTATIANNAVTFAKFQQVTGLSVVGVTGTATGNAGAITGLAGQALVVNGGGTGLAFGAVNLASATSVFGNLPVTNLNGGSGASSATFWNGAGAWVTPAGAGTVTAITAGTGLSGGTITNTGTIAFTGQIKKQVFTASGTYTASAGLITAIIECVGGGGAGGGNVDPGSGSYMAAGGGSGGYSRTYATAASVGASKTVTIGAGGTPASGSAGGNGGDTSVGVLCIAKGGTGGAANAGAGGAGGVAGTGDIAATGAGGGSGATATSGINPGPGGGGSSFFGGGAPGRGPVSGSGLTATAYGGGGGGSVSLGAGAQAGGTGSAGFVAITEFTAQ